MSSLPLSPWLMLLIPALLAALLAAVVWLGGRSRGVVRLLRVLLALFLLAIALGLAGIAVGLKNYTRLIADAPLATIELQRVAPQRFSARLQLIRAGDARGDAHDFTLLGDEWQLDARVIRWKLPALLAGAPPLYRFERIAGRYRDIQLEREAKRSVYPLGDDAWPDLWQLARRFPQWLGFVDARFGSATYLPMLDGARYTIALTPRGGLIATPADPHTRELLDRAGW